MKHRPKWHSGDELPDRPDCCIVSYTDPLGSHYSVAVYYPELGQWYSTDDWFGERIAITAWMYIPGCQGTDE
ncbi:MAG: hypothetical protein NC043_06995 [Muribaculaceae bacterium]|nr:hypothetical protein [Muribaculaceae bacterium]